MKRRYTDLPYKWHQIRKYGRLIKHEARAKVTPHSRIYLKCVVFANWRDMDTFFNQALRRGDAINSNTAAICTDLTATIESYRSSPMQLICEMDRRWFAAIGLIKGCISPEVVVHESVHAAYAYSRRVGYHWTSQKDRNDEEPVAYPAGRIAALLLCYLASENLLDK